MRFLLLIERKNLPGNHPGQNLADLLPIRLRDMLPESVQKNLARPLFSGNLPW
jgi:hypothetical protein